MLVKEFQENITGSWADLGSGGGLPGIPLAIACPGIKMHLIESVQKKAGFLTMAVEKLGLKKQITVHAARAEDLGHSVMRNSLDGLLSRAVSHTQALLELGMPLLKKGEFCWP